MDADERDICLYLKSFPEQFVSFSDICKRASGKRRYREDPEWATPVIAKLIERKIIESDSTRHYRLIKKAKDERRTKWVSPQIRQILEKSGKEFDGIYDLDADDELLGE